MRLGMLLVAALLCVWKTCCTWATPISYQRLDTRLWCERAEWAMAQSPRDCAKINEAPHLDTRWHLAEKKSATDTVSLALPKYRKYPLSLHLPVRLVLRRFQDAGHKRLKVYLSAHCCGMKEGVDNTISSSISCDWLSTANAFAASRFRAE